MNDPSSTTARRGRQLLELYDDALPEVYGYLVTRCGSAAVAEDLTSETFLAAVSAVQRNTVADLTVAWLIGVARHKLVDHWRRLERHQRSMTLVEKAPVDDDWEVDLDALLAHDTLAELALHHRSALTLRYLDGLPVADVASCLGRTLKATEVLLVRARRAFRRHTKQGSSDERPLPPVGPAGATGPGPGRVHPRPTGPHRGRARADRARTGAGA